MLKNWFRAAQTVQTIKFMNEWVFLLAAVILLSALVCSLVRAGLGPTWFDRVLAANSFGTKTVLLIAVYLFGTGHPEYIDLALLYALINYVATIALIRYLNTVKVSGHD